MPVDVLQHLRYFLNVTDGQHFRLSNSFIDFLDKELLEVTNRHRVELVGIKMLMVGSTTTWVHRLALVYGVVCAAHVLTNSRRPVHGDWRSRFTVSEDLGHHAILHLVLKMLQDLLTLSIARVVLLLHLLQALVRRDDLSQLDNFLLQSLVLLLQSLQFRFLARCFLRRWDQAIVVEQLLQLHILPVREQD